MYSVQVIKKHPFPVFFHIFSVLTVEKHTFFLVFSYEDGCYTFSASKPPGLQVPVKVTFILRLTLVTLYYII
jgi:hypothetical protein